MQDDEKSVIFSERTSYLEHYPGDRGDRWTRPTMTATLAASTTSVVIPPSCSLACLGITLT